MGTPRCCGRRQAGQLALLERGIEQEASDLEVREDETRSGTDLGPPPRLVALVAFRLELLRRAAVDRCANDRAEQAAAIDPRTATVASSTTGSLCRGAGC
jgi:hypothetical protein